MAAGCKKTKAVILDSKIWQERECRVMYNVQNNGIKLR